MDVLETGILTAGYPEVLKLTLVVDEAVGGEQFEGVDFEQDSVEQKVVSCGTEVGVVTQTRLRELLQRARRHTIEIYGPKLRSTYWNATLILHVQ